MDAHILWQMTTHVVCTAGHLIHARWMLPEAQVQVQEASRLKIVITSEKARVTYEGAVLIDGCLVCLTCGADVPSPVVETLTRAECQPEEKHEEKHV